MKKSSISVVLMLVAATACGSKKPAAKPVVKAVAVVKEPVKEAPPPPPPRAELETSITEGLATPESILYDAANDRYLISNINGGPTAVDNNGYIAMMPADGKAVEKWIVGGAKGVKLNAPKGMAIVDGILYVADITTVRKFDLKTGASKGEIKIAKSTFLNDVTASDDGKVYVSDSGLKQGAKDLEPTGTDAVYVIDTKSKKPAAKSLIASPDLKGPNGLLTVASAPGSVWVAPFGSDEIYLLDEKGAKTKTAKVPAGGMDGIVAMGDAVLISSWATSSIYKGVVDGEGMKFSVVVENVSAPADIDVDSKRGRLLIPRFSDNKIDIYNKIP
jgi:DNA-binding beta-propeller fold protein YncE